jgi:hypothetical protein
MIRVAGSGAWNFRPRCGVAPDRFHHARTSMTASLLISVLVTFLVIILILYLINMLPIDGRAKQIVRIIVIIIGVLALLKYIAVF